MSAKNDKPQLSILPILLKTPWVYLGCSRSAFYRAMAAADPTTPKPVFLPGNQRPFYRKADIDTWIIRLVEAGRATEGMVAI